MTHLKSHGINILGLMLITTSPIFSNGEQGIIKVSNQPTIQSSRQMTNQYNTTNQSIPTMIPEPPKIRVNAQAWVLMDYETGEVLTEYNMNEERPPASLTKILTAYVVGKALKSQMIKWDEPVPVSRKAWKTGGSKMFIKPNDKVTVGELFKGMAIASGNDATIALAEFVAGSEAAFVELMNRTAKSLGMNNSHFATADGLPAKDQYTSAYDIAILSRAYIHNFPNLYKFNSQKSFTYNGITQYNRNKLLDEKAGVDGIKTGYTDKAGFNLASSQVKDGNRLIAIVLGAPSNRARTEESGKLLTYGFRFFDNYDVVKSGEAVAKLHIDNAKKYQYQLPVTVKNDLILTLAKGQNKLIHLNVTANDELKAPIEKDQEVGTLEVTLRGKRLAKTPVYATEPVEKANFVTNIGHTIRSWF